MGFYIKKAIVPFAYMVFGTLIAFGITIIDNSLLWLEEILFALNFGLFAFIISVLFVREGDNAIAARHANDLQREEIIRTGEDLPLKLHEEYKPYKGFMFGLVACIPMLLCLFVHLILIIAGVNWNGMGQAAGAIYMMFYAPYSELLGGTVLSGHYMILLYAVPIICSVTGVSYLIGARRAQNRLDKIEAQQRDIYGDRK